jgi:hypothetical protein
MAASSAIHSYNSTLSYSSTENGSYTELSEVTSISDDIMVNPVKVTHLKSDSAAHEYIGGLIEAGTVTLELNFIKATLTHVFSILRSIYWFKITDSDGSVTKFKAIYQKAGKRIVEDDRISLSVDLKRTGLPTFTAAA